MFREGQSFTPRRRESNLPPPQEVFKEARKQLLESPRFKKSKNSGFWNSVCSETGELLTNWVAPVLRWISGPSKDNKIDRDAPTYLLQRKCLMNMWNTEWVSKEDVADRTACKKKMQRLRKRYNLRRTATRPSSAQKELPKKDEENETVDSGWQPTIMGGKAAQIVYVHDVVDFEDPGQRVQNEPHESLGSTERLSPFHHKEKPPIPCAWHNGRKRKFSEFEDNLHKASYLPPPNKRQWRRSELPELVISHTAQPYPQLDAGGHHQTLSQSELFVKKLGNMATTSEHNRRQWTRASVQDPRLEDMF